MPIPTTTKPNQSQTMSTWLTNRSYTGWTGYPAFQKINFLIFLSILLNLNAIDQQTVFIGTGGTMYPHTGTTIAVFGDIINNTAGGLNHNNGGTVYIYIDERIMVAETAVFTMVPRYCLYR